jgi:sugar/nucleoside kinase (ribokinase family)
VHSVFKEFAGRAEIISLADAARTHALEFEDGKLMMGELASLSEVNWGRLMERVGLARMVAMCEGADLLGLLNWTMLPHATAVWRGFAEEVLPRAKEKPRVFVDLADPKKRTARDLMEAMGVLRQLDALGARVTLGLNEAEAKQMAAAIGGAAGAAVEMAVGIRERLGLDTVVIHLPASAAAVTAQGRGEFLGPYVAKPAILTGGGDHFNAGFSLGQLMGLPVEMALCLATATSGYYVREAESPGLGKLAGFLENLP